MNLTKHNYWLEHFKEWRNSGLSHNEYCLKQGINIKLFSSWKTRLYKANPELKDSITSKSPTFLPINLVQDENLTHESGISIQFPNDIKISLSKTFDEATLSRVVNIISKKNV